jgi:hypothetical protein
MMRVISIAVLFAGAVLACAPPSTVPGAGATRNANVITREDIKGTNASNAYEAVSRLRPKFLNSHGATTFSPNDTGLPNVYLNHSLYGDIESLRNIDVSSISEIHYYSAPEASTRFGRGNVSGAIEVTTDASR